MIIGLLLLLVGIILIFANPLLGFIPGILLILIGLVVVVLGGLLRGVGVLARVGSTKKCSECRSDIPSDGSVCRYCGHYFNEG